MRIDQDFDLRSGRLADQRGKLGGLTLAFLGQLPIEIAVRIAGRAFVVGKGIELDSGMAAVDDLADLLDHALLAAEFRLVRMGVDEDVVANGPTEQFVDRRVSDLADKVPERDVDAAD